MYLAGDTAVTDTAHCPHGADSPVRKDKHDKDAKYSPELRLVSELEDKAGKGPGSWGGRAVISETGLTERIVR